MTAVQRALYRRCHDSSSESTCLAQLEMWFGKLPNQCNPWPAQPHSWRELLTDTTVRHLAALPPLHTLNPSGCELLTDAGVQHLPARVRVIS